ncbi:MAG TPA: alpha/beta fold hydrolase, partial [Anaerolineales bacterium]
GHATRPDDMHRSNYEDWMGSVEDAYHLLKGSTAHVYLVGLSMGGALALLMSTRLDVRGVVAISTPIALLKDYPLWLIRLLAVFRHYLPKSNDAPDTGWHDPNAWKDHVSYPQNPIRSVGQLKELLTRLRSALPLVKVPTLLIHSRDDTYVLPENMTRIHAAVGSADKRMLWITGSGHVVPRDAARAQVFAAVYDFIQQVDSKA